MSRSRRRSRGAAALELVLVAPVLFILLDFAVLGGRLVESQSQVDDSAHAAARAASLQRTVTGAALAARTVATDTLPQRGATCSALDVQVDTAAFHPGGVVSVTVRCDVSLGDLSWLPLPASRSIEGTATSAVDLYRGATP